VNETMIDSALDAGAVLPVGTELGERRDTVSARSYAHPALDGRTVVRLASDALGGAEDLTLEFLGFAAAAPPVPVGVLREQALGFPAWALVHDPANGRHALNLVKDIERLSRVAVTKPGLAKEGFDELAKQLAGAVPHFLPTFYEQAARVFLAAENLTLAAGFFNRAREAERAYSLTVDEAAQGAAFLEFALAGALTAKALTEYARALAARAAPEQAYAQFRRICLERTAGGLPPYSAMPADLRRLAKAAGREDLAEEIALARELLPLPATARAAAGFWTAYRTTLLRVAKADPAVRGLLLSIMPYAAGEPGVEDPWLLLLEESGAAAGLTEPADTLPAEVLSPDGASGWLVRYDARQGGYSRWRYRNVSDMRNHRLLDLVERMAPRLRAEAAKPALCGRGYADIDLIDLCLSLGVELADPDTKRYFSIDLPDWLSRGSDRELSAFAADPRLRPYLYEAIAGLADSGFDPKDNALVLAAERLIAAPGLRSVLHQWLDDQARLLETGGLVDLEERLRLLDAVAQPRIIAVNPDAFRRMSAIDVGTYLGHALRSGIFDEYGWPALEEACARLAGVAPGAVPEPVKPAVQAKRKRSVFQRGHQQPVTPWALTAQWPYLVVQSDLRAAVVDGSGTRLEHTVSLPTGQNSNIRNAILRYVDDQLMVAWNGHPDNGAYFTGDPTRIHTSEVAIHYGDSSLELPGGGRTFGDRPLTAGSPHWSTRGRVASDGTDYWTLMWHGEPRMSYQWVEFDPRTGELGRASAPSFFARPIAVPGEWAVRPDLCRLAPAADGMQTSPLGTAGGLVGHRLYFAPDGSHVFEGVDGRRTTVPGPQPGHRPGPNAVGLLTFPGALTLLTVLHPKELNLAGPDGERVAILTPTMQAGLYSRGTWCVPPLNFWHYLTVRDMAGSAALRALTDTDARALAVAAAARSSASGEPAVVSVSEEPALAGDLDGALPQVTNAKLRAGIAGYAQVAAWCQRRIESLAARIEQAAIAPEPAAEPLTSRLTWDGAFRRGRNGLCPTDVTDGLAPQAALRVLSELLLGPDRPTDQDVARLRLDNYQAGKVWAELCQTGFALPALAYRAVSAGTGAEERAALLEFLRLWAASPLGAPDGAIRLLTVGAPEKVRAATQVVQDTPHGRVIVLNMARWSNDDSGAWYAVEYSRDGQFAGVPRWTVESDYRPRPWPWPGTSVAEFCDLAEARGAVPVRLDQADELSAACGLSVAEARVLLAGLLTRNMSYNEVYTAEIREAVGLKAMALQAAGKRFFSLSTDQAIQLVTGLLPPEPEQLWTSGPRVDLAAQQWIALKGKQIPLPGDLLAAASKLDLAETIQGLVNPAGGAWLAGGADRAMTADRMAKSVTGLVWLAYHLPVGDPLRAPLPLALATIRERLKDPEFSFRVGYTDNADQMAAALGFSYVHDKTVTKDHKWRYGPIEFVAHSEWRTVVLYPAELSGADDPVLAYLARGEGFAYMQSEVNAVLLLLGKELDALLEHGLPDGSSGVAPYPAQDPARSAPELLAEAAGKLDLGPDAAALYLMLLALPDPTDRNQAAWTGWKPARLKAARTELAATDLVVSGTRPRAGRTLFLPGGWHALKTPHLPLEHWKGPLLGVEPTGGVPLDLIAPLVPVAELFTAAWQRVRSGDAPRYNELTTGKKR
jgi:hypothetical protein